MTIPRFDIFRVDKGGSLLWIGTAEDIEEARKRVTEHPSRSKEFFLLDSRTGAKVVLNTNYLSKSA
jgi:hypothetical protein